MSDIVLTLKDHYAAKDIDAWMSCLDAANEIESLRAALEPFACQCSVKGEGAGGTCLAPGGICRAWNARSALEVK